MSDNTKTPDINFGAFAPSIPEQLKEQGVPFDQKKADGFHDSREFATNLYFSGYITSNEYSNILYRIMKDITKHVNAEIKKAEKR